MTMSFPEDAFTRRDETDDALFYQRDRFVSHLDTLALSTIEDLIGRLVIEEKPVLLDLMASWDSHIPNSVRPARVVGLGLNENELSRNKALSEHAIHDLNRHPELPYAADTFDGVLCTVSVEYLTRPQEVFREVGRVLRPGGLFLVTYSNRFFPPKVVKIWRDSRDDERLLLVLDLFVRSKAFDEPRVFVSRGKPRPGDDEYAHLGIPSDPIYAVYADMRGRSGERRARATERLAHDPIGEEEIAGRKRQVKHTLTCPYCGRRFTKWVVPDSPFIEWPNEFFYVCFNDDCAYFTRGWTAMAAQGNPGSYRLMYDPIKDSFYPAPAYSSTIPKG